MFPAECQRCGSGIAEDHRGDWVDQHGLTTCFGNEETHAPYDIAVDSRTIGDINKLKLRHLANTYYADSQSRPKKNHKPQPGINQIWKELQNNPPKLLSTEEDPWIDGEENLEPVESSKASYCAGCHSKFPSSQGYPLTQNGETLVLCPVCSDDGEVFSENNNFQVSASNEDEAMDPQTAPAMQSAEQQGIEKITQPSNQQPKRERSIQGYDGYTGVDPSNPSAKLLNVPSGFGNNKKPKPLPAMTEGLTQDMVGTQTMGAGNTGEPPTNSAFSKGASYQDLAKHLVNNCKFCKSLWRQGYDAPALKLEHDQAHKHSAYALDHESVMKDLAHQTMVTSSKNFWWL